LSLQQGRSKVAKHGNYGVSSISGSSNVMEKLGIKFSDDADFLKRSIDKAGICVLHAPLFHPAMKNVGPIRKELAVKTFLICWVRWSIHHPHRIN
jgi:anthranilate phosphoribosyltransferase